jgi:RNA polymerase sigma-70 factor (ECF subfamily)
MLSCIESRERSAGPNCTDVVTGATHADLCKCLERIADGDRDALGELYDATVARVFALAQAILSETTDAEDVVCEVYMHVWQHTPNYRDGGATALTWLLTVCRSRALARLRCATVEASIPPGPDILELVERGTIVRGVLETLMPLQRLFVAMAFFQGLNHGEIAQQCRLPVGIVKSHMRRALMGLRAGLR